jgi:hypothetical protein
VSIPSSLRRNSLHVIIARHGYPRDSDDVSVIHLLDHGVDFVAVETGGAVAGFKVDGYAGSGGE